MVTSHTEVSRDTNLQFVGARIIHKCKLLSVTDVTGGCKNGHERVFAPLGAGSCGRMKSAFLSQPVYFGARCSRRPALTGPGTPAAPRPCPPPAGNRPGW